MLDSKACRVHTWGKGSGWSKELKRWLWDGCEEGTALG